MKPYNIKGAAMPYMRYWHRPKFTKCTHGNLVRPILAMPHQLSAHGSAVTQSWRQSAIGKIKLWKSNSPFILERGREKSPHAAWYIIRIGAHSIERCLSLVVHPANQLLYGLSHATQQILERSFIKPSGLWPSCFTSLLCQYLPCGTQSTPVT